jgi:hypothetical protein
MKLHKIRLYVAGLFAFLIGVPLTERAFAGTGDIIDASVGLAGAIVDSAQYS